MMLSVGHDEYWSWGMRDRADEFVEAGGGWAILSGNTCFWQVRYEDDFRARQFVDGALGAEYLKELRHLLENPALLLV